MTQAKPDKRTENKSEKDKIEEKDEENFARKYFSENCIQVSAWVLLTVGLCIIITTFYLAIRHTKNDTEEDVPVFADSIDSIDKAMEVLFELNKTTRSVSDDDDDEFSLNLDFRGCQEKFCKVVCQEADSIYDAVYNTLSYSNCSSADVLLISHQPFPNGIVKNSWIYTGQSVYELVLDSSNVTKIKADAFNSPMFSSTFMLMWRNLKLKKVESGALLGLNSLRFLTISSQLSCLDRAFFQPVQTTLKHLKLNAGLNILGDQNLFGISELKKLEYADLSQNNLIGTLTKAMFLSTPNLNYLVMARMKITSIEEDAFESLVGHLLLLNISENLLTTLDGNVLASLLAANSKTFVSSGSNNWNCDCDIHALRSIYITYRSQFIDAIYCKAPHKMYGTFLENIDLKSSGCHVPTTTVQDTIEEMDTLSTSTTILPYGNVSDDETSSREGNSQEAIVFRMRCLNAIDSDSSSSSSNARSFELFVQNTDTEASDSTEVGDTTVVDVHQKSEVMSFVDEGSTEDHGTDLLNNNMMVDSSELNYFQFEPPGHEFELVLLTNRSVTVIIPDFSALMPVNIIWFSEQMENFDFTHAGATYDYDCMGYTEPYLLIDSLLENTTYTFCVIGDEYTITPFNCLPLYVPVLLEHNENIWISKDEKPFTVGILCLIFLLSTFLGAVVAYFGIKTYPDLLEGSKNVLVVKKYDQNCYVSTISETEYLKNSSIKKKPIGSSMKKNPINSCPSLPEVPTSASPPPPFSISVKNLERLSSVKSSSTLFEDSFGQSPFPEDEYEMPKNYEINHYYEDQRCVPNNYGMSPRSPPPLPKRNSHSSDTLNLVMNRFSKN